MDLENNFVAIQAVVVDDIIHPTTGPYRDKLISIPHPKNLKLAHPLNGKSKFSINIFVGSNDY